jgi:hypothetical protein
MINLLPRADKLYHALSYSVQEKQVTRSVHLTNLFLLDTAANIEEINLTLT